MAQGKTKIKNKLPANSKQNNKTNKKNSAFPARKSKSLEIFRHNF